MANQAFIIPLLSQAQSNIESSSTAKASYSLISCTATPAIVPQKGIEESAKLSELSTTYLPQEDHQKLKRRATTALRKGTTVRDNQLTLMVLLTVKLTPAIRMGESWEGFWPDRDTRPSGKKKGEAQHQWGRMPSRGSSQRSGVCNYAFPQYGRAPQMQATAIPLSCSAVWVFLSTCVASINRKGKISMGVRQPAAFIVVRRS